MVLDRKSKSILNFRPNIHFEEPEQQESPIQAVQVDSTPQEIENKRLKIKNLADSVYNLARAVQIKIDNKSKDQIIILDSGMDNAVIRALRRSYPNAVNFDRITYNQYKTCRDRLRDYSSRVALRSAISQDEVDSARSQMSNGKFTVGGINTEESTNGGLRPELDDRNRLIEPLDMESLQNELLKALFNMLWNTFIVPILKAFPFIGSAVKKKEIKLSKSTEQLLANTQEDIEAASVASRQARTDIESGKIDLSSKPSTASSPKISLPEIENPIQFQDCNLIVKAYEKGCHASMTEASVFAPFTNQLDFIQNMSSTISKQMDSYSPQKNRPDNDSSFSDFLSNIFPDDLDASINLQGSAEFGLLDSECIPCGFRINFNEELGVKIAISDIGSYMLEMMEAWLQKALSQIRNLIDMFKNLDHYIDICTFLDFFKNFVCIPDLAKILAILAALMMDLSFELNAIIDFAISLIVPLFVPFLTNLLDSLMKYVLLIIQPIECIIDSIQNLLGKLDYNVLFQNIPSQVQLLKSNAIKIPVLGALVPEGGVSFDLSPAVRAQREKEQATVDKAYENLRRLQKASANVDASDSAAYEKYKEQETQARQEYQDAVKERDLSEIGEANLAIEKFQTQLKGTILQLISLLREAVLKFDAWVSGIFEEFKKLLNQYVGGTGLYINFGVKKLGIIQMIAFITSLIKLLNKDISCDDEDKEVEVFANSVSKESGFKIFTDENGDIFIEENIKEIDDVVDALNIQNPKSLINYTGDKVLDETLSDTVKKLTIPNRLKIKCSLTSSVKDQEKVNQWISELNSG